MLPFARMVKYGNKAPERADTLIKMQAPSAFTNNTLMLLYKKGDLWGIGGNNAGIFGLGNTTTQTTWVRLMQNVKNFWCTRNSSYSLVQTNDNKFYYTGSNVWTGTSSEVQSTTFVECTSYFSGINIDDIKEIYPNVRNLFVLTNSGILYAIGNNATYELGTTSTMLTALTQVNINVKKVSVFFNSPTWIIKNDNTAWRCGSTTTGTLLTGAATATLTSWTKYDFGTGKYPIDIFSHTNMLGIVVYSDGTYPLYGVGSQFYGQLGNGVTTNTNKTALTPQSTYLQLTNVSDFEFIQLHSQSTRGILYRNGSRIFSTGYNNYGQLGNNSTTNASVFVQTQLPSSVVFDPETSLIAANDASLFVYAGDKLYYTGMSPIGTVTGTWTLTEYQLPQF